MGKGKECEKMQEEEEKCWKNVKKEEEGEREKLEECRKM